MSAITRAIIVMSQHARAKDQDVNKIVDAKEKDLREQRKVNDVLDALEAARSDDNFTYEEKQGILALAERAGLDLSADEDFSRFENVHGAAGRELYDGNAWLDDDRTDAASGRRDQLDDVADKINRTLKAAQDASGQSDLKLKLSMNDLTQSLQDANGMVSTMKQLREAMTIGR